MPDEDSDELLARMEEAMAIFQRECAALDQRRLQDALQRERELESRPRVEYRTVSTQPSPFMGDPVLEDDPIPGSGGKTPDDDTPTTRFTDVVFSDFYRGGFGGDHDADAAWAAGVTDANGRPESSQENVIPTTDDGLDYTWQNLGGILASGSISVVQTKTNGDYGSPSYGAYPSKIDRWFFKTASSTGYLKIYWDETIYSNSGVVSRTSYTYVIDRGSSFGGDPNDPNVSYDSYVATPDKSVDYEVLHPPTPTADEQQDDHTKIGSSAYDLFVENVRWSAMRNYVPPVNGSANGFPSSP